MVSATVTLYKDIGLDSNYNRTMLFDTKTQQNNWFKTIPANQKLTLSDVNYNKMQNSFAIHEQIGDVYGYSYVSIEDLDDSGRIYYGFISAVTLIDDETTRFDIVLDPIQTFMTEWTLGECLVNREHCDRWESSSDEPIRISPLQEGAVGNAVSDTDYQFRIPPIDIGTGKETPEIEIATAVLVFSQDVTLTDDGGNKTEETRVFYGVVPISLVDVPCTTNIVVNPFDNQPIQGDIEILTKEDVINGSWADNLGLNPDQILGAYITQMFPIQFHYDTFHTVFTRYAGAYNDTGECESGWSLLGGYPADQEINVVFYNEVKDGANHIHAIQVLTETQISSLMTDPYEWQIDATKLSETSSVGRNMPDKPSNNDTANSKYEPQLYMAPIKHCYITDSMYNILMPIADTISFKENLTLKISAVMKTTGPTIVISGGANPQQYAIYGTSVTIPMYSLDVLNDAWRSYCLTQRDSDRRMMWSNIISNTVNQAVFMGYGGALVGSRSNSGRNDPMKDGVGDVAGYGGAMVRAMGFGLGASLVTSMVSGYDMWIQQDAKEQSIRNTPSTLNMSGDGFGMVIQGFHVVCTRLDKSNYDSLYEKFQKYGYVVNSMETPNLKSRKYFNYICTSNTTIKGSLPADIKQGLVNIFEKGITFFHADYCSDTEYPQYENIERTLI